MSLAGARCDDCWRNCVAAYADKRRVNCRRSSAMPAIDEARVGAAKLNIREFVPYRLRSIAGTIGMRRGDASRCASGPPSSAAGRRRLMRRSGWMLKNPLTPAQWLASRGEARATKRISDAKVLEVDANLETAHRLYRESERMIANRAAQLSDMLKANGVRGRCRRCSLTSQGSPAKSARRRLRRRRPDVPQSSLVRRGPRPQRSRSQDALRTERGQPPNDATEQQAHARIVRCPDCSRG